jgi:hypothetical protein
MPRHSTPPPSTPNKTEQDVVLHLSIPASLASHDIAVYMTPKKATASSTTPTTDTSTVPQPDFNGAAEFNVGDIKRDYIANHCRPFAAKYKQYGVPRNIAAKFPAAPRGRGNFGWRVKVYYAVIKGLDVGVFHDYWYEIYYY